MGKTGSSLGPGGAEETRGLNSASQSSKCWQTLFPPFTALSGRGWALRCHSRLATGWGCLGVRGWGERPLGWRIQRAWPPTLRGPVPSCEEQTSALFKLGERLRGKVGSHHPRMEEDWGLSVGELLVARTPAGRDTSQEGVWAMTDILKHLGVE